MLELRFIRENIAVVREKVIYRGLEDTRVEEFAEVDNQRLDLLSRVEALRNKRNTASKEIAELKKKGADAEQLMSEMRVVGDEIKELTAKLTAIEESLQDIVMGIPNLCDESVPRGNDESENIEVKKWGDIPSFDFEPKAHWDIGVDLARRWDLGVANLFEG